MAKRNRPIAAFDFETDPFQRGGGDIEPFVWGFYDGTQFEHYWGADCVIKFVAFLDTLSEPHLIYAHNGGRFDFLFMLKHLAREVTVISGRIVSCMIGDHELRDSYAILPVKLADAANKAEFDYSKMAAGKRHRHRAAILKYLEQDCTELYGAVLAFIGRLGNKLTMAGAAMARLLDSMERTEEGIIFQRLTMEQDAQFRPWFFGGRVEYFEKGEIVDPMTLIDRVSMYPTVMADREHPTGNQYLRQRAIDDRTDFVAIDATSQGAFPARAADGSLTFPHGRGIFKVTGHEVRKALEFGKVVIHRLIWAAYCPLRMNFAPFILPHFQWRQEAMDRGDEIGKLHYKLVLNSSYGRWSLNPDKLKEWQIVPKGSYPMPDSVVDGQELYDLARSWEPAFTGNDVVFWRRDVTFEDKRRAIMNVATGASITGAARAELAAVLWQSERPVYCDTDSVVARGFNMPLDDGSGGLGAWKVETTASHAWIAGKKLYALADGWREATVDQVKAGRFVTLSGARVPVVKMASKGARLTGDQIAHVARGGMVDWEAETPSITIAGVQTYLKRQIRMR